LLVHRSCKCRCIFFVLSCWKCNFITYLSTIDFFGMSRCARSVGDMYLGYYFVCKILPLLTIRIRFYFWFRLWRAVVTYERHTRALRVPVGEPGRQDLRTCRWTFLQLSCQCCGNGRHPGWDDVVQSERQVTVSAQSQVSSTVRTVSRRTRQL